MIGLTAYVPESALAEVLQSLSGRPGVDHLLSGGQTDRGLVCVTADVDPGLLDALLKELVAIGVAGDEILVVRSEANRPAGTARVGDIPAWSGGGLAWSYLAMSSRHYAQAVPQYLVFMCCAGVIAAFGILTSNSILIVGAMAISPDLLPLCAISVGLVQRQRTLAGRALAALLVGLASTGLAAFVITWVLGLAGYPPATGSLGNGGLGVLPTVNVATVVVAFFAGIAGMLSFETKASAAVGVAISITTIPAASFCGAAIAIGDLDGAGGAVGVLAVNIVMLVLAGTLTLLLQRRMGRTRTSYFGLT